MKLARACSDVYVPVQNNEAKVELSRFYPMIYGAYAIIQNTYAFTVYYDDFTLLKSWEIF